MLRELSRDYYCQQNREIFGRRRSSLEEEESKTSAIFDDYDAMDDAGIDSDAWDAMDEFDKAEALEDAGYDPDDYDLDW